MSGISKEEVMQMANEAGMDIGLTATIMCNKTSLEQFAVLIAKKERDICIADCMEQHKQSIIAAEKAKKVRDQDTYFNTATGAKFAAIRIMQRGDTE